MNVCVFCNNLRIGNLDIEHKNDTKSVDCTKYEKDYATNKKRGKKTIKCVHDQTRLGTFRE